MDYKEKATILRVCSSRKGERCSRCPAFGYGNRNCMKNAMKDGATAITDLLARAEEAERERDEAVHDRMVMEQKTAELVDRAEKAERERDTYKAALQNWHEEG